MVDFKQTLFKEAVKIGIELNKSALERFYIYMKLIQEYNDKINITANDTEEEILYKHFIDSLTLYKHIKKKNARCIDIGTGAGFPMVPLKIVDDSLEITLVDSVHKKIDFLNILKKEIMLDNTECVHARAEDLAWNEKYRESYDYALSRAVGSLSLLTEYCIPFLKIEGRMLAMKGPYIDDFGGSLKELDAKVIDIEQFEMEYIGERYKRSIIIISKTGTTLKKYPRKAGMAKKFPL